MRVPLPFPSTVDASFVHLQLKSNSKVFSQLFALDCVYVKCRTCCVFAFCLLIMSKHGAIHAAHNLFVESYHKNVVCWTSLKTKEAEVLLKSMPMNRLCIDL